MNIILHQNKAAERRAKVTQQLDLNRIWRLHALTPSARMLDRAASKASVPASEPKRS